MTTNNCIKALLLNLIVAHVVSAFVVSPNNLNTQRQRPRRQQLTDLSVVIDAGENIGRRRRNDGGDDNRYNNDEHESGESFDDSWIQTPSGGFLPNLSRRVRRMVNPSTTDSEEIEMQRMKLQQQSSRQIALDYGRSGNVNPILPETTVYPPNIPKVQQVLSIDEYKTVVVDEKDAIVVVRFYAPWCRACKAIANRYRQQLPAKFGSTMKFVEVPLTKENAFLHDGLGVPSLPFAHVYYPNVGLVEECKINQKIFPEFVNILQTYHQGYCTIQENIDEALLDTNI